MKRKFLACGMVLLVAALMGVSTAAMAADGGAAAPAGDQKPNLMTQGELAQLLVKKLGLYRFLSANPSDLECIMLLSQNGIFPSPNLVPTEQNPTPGWNLDPSKEVSLADLAVILVRALRLEDRVQGDVADPQNWLNVLKDVQVPTDTVGAGVASLMPLADALIGLPFQQMTQDPINKQYVPESTGSGVINTIAFPDVTGGKPAAPEGKPPTPITPT